MKFPFISLLEPDSLVISQDSKVKEAVQWILPSNVLLIKKNMRTKTERELMEDMKFQEMKRFLGIRRVRNFCSGCGEEIHEPVYCLDCQEEIERLRLRNRYK